MELECHDLQFRGKVASFSEIIDCLESSFESDLTGLVRLAEIARVASVFGSLMYEMLISRSDLAVAVGAFAVGVISLLVTDAGIVHGGAMHVLCCVDTCMRCAILVVVYGLTWDYFSHVKGRWMHMTIDNQWA